MAWDLIGDIGGTNARFAAVTDGVVAARISYPTADGLPDALAKFMAGQSAPRLVALAGGGKSGPDGIELTNANTALSRAQAAEITRCETLHFINDFAAQAYALRRVSAYDVLALQGPSEPPTGLRAILGPGTGLGVGMLDPRGFVLPGEGGHVCISPQSAEDIALFEKFIALKPEFRIGQGLCLEAEAFLSGTGLPYLYRALEGDKTMPAENIMHSAKSGADPIATRATNLFCRYLAQVAGNLAVTMLPRGGVFLTGGIAQKNQWLFDKTFVAHFTEGGRFTDLRREMPLYLVTNEDFGLIGVQEYLGTL